MERFRFLEKALCSSAKNGNARRYASCSFKFSEVEPKNRKENWNRDIFEDRFRLSFCLSFIPSAFYHDGACIHQNTGSRAFAAMKSLHSSKRSNLMWQIRSSFW